MKRYLTSEIAELAGTRPEAHRRAFEIGTLAEHNLYLLVPDDFNLEGIQELPPPPTVSMAAVEPKEPTVSELWTNFSGAVAKWRAAGFPLVTSAQLRQRVKACGQCELWDGSARGGLGKCNAPGCGCTKFKRFLATEQCRHPDGSRWTSAEPPR